MTLLTTAEADVIWAFGEFMAHTTASDARLCSRYAAAAATTAGRRAPSCYPPIPAAASSSYGLLLS